MQMSHCNLVGFLSLLYKFISHYLAFGNAFIWFLKWLHLFCLQYTKIPLNKNTDLDLLYGAFSVSKISV